MSVYQLVRSSVAVVTSAATFERNDMKDIEYKITEEALQALFQGQKIIFDTYGLPRVTLYPPRYGVFVTHEKYQEIVRRAKTQGFEYVIEMLGELGAHKPKTN